tara:strand:- start:488 stop:679 length:192 start_codon:yes stop_codon:yes gene_type:complete
VRPNLPTVDEKIIAMSQILTLQRDLPLIYPKIGMRFSRDVDDLRLFVCPGWHPSLGYFSGKVA